MWVKHKGSDERGGVAGVEPEAALLALADFPPPAACSLFQAPAPIASLTWHADLLENAAMTSFAGGWWLLRSRLEYARAGYSSEDVELWGSQGMALVARQCVALYA